MSETRSLSDAAPVSRPVVAADPAEPAIAPGDCLGRFTVRARIGAGGMGEVFSAHDPELDRLVALKILRPGVGGESPEARARFQREAQAMARLNHPNVVSVFDVDTVRDRVFVAMELVPGPTLAAWLAERPRRWREVVAAFLEAGRGLEAAHRAGIVHRDFKPLNVIVGDRVRVADFGLARAIDDGGTAPAATAATPLDLVVTQTGQALGTPKYMAPEVRAGQGATPASDQYSYAVALDEALAGARHPRWLRDVVARALRQRPEERYPAMRALLADLGRDRERARRRWLAAAALASVAGGTLVAHELLATPACAAADASIAPLWDAAARARVEAAFVRSGRPYASDTFARVDATIHKRLAGWAHARHDACAATYERHEQSETLFDLRMRCLQRARDEAATMVALLGDADARAVDRAASAVATIADPAPCADVAQLTSVVPPPRDPNAKREDEAIRVEADRVLALSRLGRGADSVAAARALVPRARALGHAPALSAALRAATLVEGEAGDLDAVTPLGYSAVRAAEDAHDDATRAEVLTALLFTLGFRQHRFAEAEALAPVAEGAVARAGHPPRLLAALHHRMGAVLEAKGDYTGALGRYVAELGFAVNEVGWFSRPVSLALNDLADVEAGLGRHAAARATSEQAIKVVETIVGPEHPWLATPLAGYAQAAINLGDYEPAAQALGRAIAILEQTYGREHEHVGLDLMSLAWIRTMQGRLDEARALADQAGGILEKLGPEAPSFLVNLGIRADIYARRGELDEALTLAERAHALRSRIDGPEHEWTARAQATIGDIQRRRGRLAEARAAFERALATLRKVLGPDHLTTATVEVQLAEVLNDQGHTGEAVRLCERALPIAESDNGPENPFVVQTLGICAEALLGAGDGARALTLAERADRTAAAHHMGPDVESVARAIHAATLLPSDRARACALGREARAAAAGLPASKWRADLDRWLARNCPRRE